MILINSIGNEKKMWLFVLVGLFFFVGCTNGTKANDPFLDLVGESVMLNGPLTISANENEINFSGQFEDYFVIDIFNHSDESIFFQIWILILEHLKW